MDQQYKTVEYVDVSKIQDHPEVPNIRKEVTKADVKELMASIKEKGVQNPITCFKKDNIYYLVSGWRRRKAVQEITKEDPKASPLIPVLLKQYAEKTIVRDALFDNMIENIQRKDVNPLDQANRIKMLMDQGMNKLNICKEIGKSITWVNDTLNVLDADPEVREKIRSGEITMSDAKGIAKLPSETQATVAKGLAAAKKTGDKSATQKIQRGVDEATRTRSHAMPTKKEIKYNKNVLTEILMAMKAAKEEDTKQYYVLSGCLLIAEWVLGERGETNFGKYVKKYNLELGTDGNKLVKKNPKKKTAKKKAAKKVSKKKVAKKKKK